MGLKVKHLVMYSVRVSTMAHFCYDLEQPNKHKQLIWDICMASDCYNSAFPIPSISIMIYVCALRVHALGGMFTDLLCE